MMFKVKSLKLRGSDRPYGPNAASSAFMDSNEYPNVSEWVPSRMCTLFRVMVSMFLILYITDAPSIKKIIASHSHLWSESSHAFFIVLNDVKLLVFLVCSGNPCHALMPFGRKEYLYAFVLA